MEPKQSNKYLIMQDFLNKHYLVPIWNRIQAGDQILREKGLSQEHRDELDKLKAQYQELYTIHGVMSEMIYMIEKNNEFFEGMKTLFMEANTDKVEHPVQKLMFGELKEYVDRMHKKNEEIKESNLDPKFIEYFSKIL